MITQNDRSVDKTVVEILTTNRNRTLLVEQKQGQRNILGINSISQGRVVHWQHRLPERGFVNSDRTLIYMIDAQAKTLTSIAYDQTLFLDADKVSSSGEYEWHGTRQRILEEFEKAGYKINHNI